MESAFKKHRKTTEPPIECVPPSTEPLLERAQSNPSVIREILEKIEELYSEYQSSDDVQRLKEAAGIAYRLRELHEQGKILLPEETKDMLSTLLAENITIHIREHYVNLD